MFVDHPPVRANSILFNCSNRFYFERKCDSRNGDKWKIRCECVRKILHIRNRDKLAVARISPLLDASCQEKISLISRVEFFKENFRIGLTGRPAQDIPE